jgi:DNA-binding MarR family transcriptional regulator
MAEREPSKQAMKIIDAIDSLQELQMLVVLMEDPDRWWDAGALATDTGNAPSVTRRTLDRLAARNLLDIRVTEEVRFRYRPGTFALEEAGSAFLDAYHKNPIAVARMIAVRGTRPAKDFADAFRIRRDDDR